MRGEEKRGETERGESKRGEGDIESGVENLDFKAAIFKALIIDEKCIDFALLRCPEALARYAPLYPLHCISNTVATLYPLHCRSNTMQNNISTHLNDVLLMLYSQCRSISCSSLLLCCSPLFSSLLSVRFADGCDSVVACSSLLLCCSPLFSSPLFSTVG